MYIKTYKAPFATIYMRSDGKYLTGLWFENSKDAKKHQFEFIEKDLPIFDKTTKWLDIYFSGKNPDFIPEYKIENLTPFRKQVIEIMNRIPYGKTITYNDIAKEIAKTRNIKKMSAQAVGGAVGWNPICIIIPCHRVIGTDGSLTGYGGGLENKVKLLELENNNKPRCKWCNMGNPLYVKYHDEEWCELNFDDKYLFEMLILESFQAGLSWECVLNKREDFRKAYDNFDINKICKYDNSRIQQLLFNENIIRNKLKINASINNSKIFSSIQKEYGSFCNYLKTYTKNQTFYEVDKTTSELSDEISKDLRNRGMKFVGSTIIYSYLQAIGIIYSHDKKCYKFKDRD